MMDDIYADLRRFALALQWEVKGEGVWQKGLAGWRQGVW